MICLNRAQIIGYLTQDPEIRQTPAGVSVGDLNLMSKSKFVNLEGKVQISTAFHNAVVWRGLADLAQKYLRKGRQVYLAGRIQTESWEDQQGNKKYRTKIITDDMILLDPKNPLPPLSDESEIGGGLNRTEILGNTCRAPELRTTPAGMSVCSFGVATNEQWKGQDGSMQERTEFHNVVVWGKLAEKVSQGIAKGQKVYIMGRLQTRSWDTPDGVKKYTTEIIADEVLSLGHPNAEIGAPAPMENSGGDFHKNVPPTSDVAAGIPEINYESEIKPEDLPF